MTELSDWRAEVDAADQASRRPAVEHGGYVRDFPSDMRAGVTSAQHAVFDLLDEHRAAWGEISPEEQSANARLLANVAAFGHEPVLRRDAATEAAARLLDALEKMGAGR